MPRLMEAEPRVSQFMHEVAFYSGPEDQVRAIAPFIREGLEHDEPVLVALLPDRIELLRRELGADGAGVVYEDMAELGANPARIIPAWQQFLDEHAGRGPVRGVGEPAWPGRRDVELAEAALHESLLNLAFDRGPGWRLLCPYDVTAHPTEILEEALRNHPVVHDGKAHPVDYAGHEHARRAFSATLSPAPDTADAITFERGDLSVLRALVVRTAESTRLSGAVVDRLALAVHELAVNSVLHGGGRGELRIWHDAGALVMEVRDRGRIHDPMAGRVAPHPHQESGRGLWIVHQLCDLVQIRSCESGTRARVYTWL